MIDLVMVLKKLHMVACVMLRKICPYRVCGALGEPMIMVARLCSNFLLTSTE